MMGKAGAELDLAKLDLICQERKLQRQQKMREEINSKLARIARSCNPPSEQVTRPYGVEREGAANDVWHHILERVADPSEIASLWNVSGMFRDILRAKYIETRLPEIFLLILKERSKYLIHQQSNVTFETMRLVSKQCKVSVEDIICRSNYKCGLTFLDFFSIAKVQRICEIIEENPSFAASFLPFVFVVIDEQEVPDDLIQFRQAIRDFLLVAGQNIRSFTYYSSLETSQDIYNCLREWASFLPNLERLVFGRNVDSDEDAPELEEIAPFPNLPMIRCIEEGSTISGVVSSPFIMRIVQACPGIKKLKFKEDEHIREHSPQVLETSRSLDFLQICPYRSLLLHRNLPWKLKKLILSREDLTMYRDERTLKATVSSCRLFPFLNQFEDTLEHLEFNMVDVCDGCGYLDLRNLKTLKMELHESYDNLDFLFYAESLETLEVRVGDEFMWHLSPEEKFSRIISRSFLGKSVWKVFPYLKQFQLRTTKYSQMSGAKFEEFRTVWKEGLTSF